jgi:lipoyl(octanoyl) transferase
VDTGRLRFPKLILYLDDTPHDGAWNMAVDQALLERVSVPVLRVYRWDRATVTIGYAQNLDALRSSLPAWPVVRRWTGGGVVFHDGDHTYSLIVPAVCEWSQTRPVESYRQVHGSLAQALVRGGHEGCRLARAEDVIDRPFCFEAPAVHDIVRGEEKIAGAGQRRSRIGSLHQGSVQNVSLDEAFWIAWAESLTSEITVMREMAEDVSSAAEVLRERRYNTENWLLHREDGG